MAECERPHNKALAADEPDGAPAKIEARAKAARG